MRGLTLSVAVATHGDGRWADLARERAVPSILSQRPEELVVLHEPEGTLASARNRAAQLSRSSHLVFLDADDELGEDYLEAFRRAHAVLTGPALELGGGDPRWRPTPTLLVPRLQRVHADGTEDEPEFPNRHRLIEELNHCVIGTALPRLLFLALGGFRDDLDSLEDWELFLRMKRAGAQFLDVAGAVYRAHVQEGSRNADQSTYHRIRQEHEDEMRRMQEQGQ